MKLRSALLVLILAFTVACSGSNKLISDTGPSGAYEFVVTSNVTGGVTLVEANLAANGSQSSASGPLAVQILTLENKIWYVNGSCPGATPGQNEVTLTNSGNNLTLTFNEGGRTLPAQGALTGSTIAGNYSINGSSCPDLQGRLDFPPGFDQGGFVGNQVPDLAGTFSGPLNLPDGTHNAALTLVENPDHTLNVTAQLTGLVDNGTFAFTGSVIGNIMFVTGDVNGRTLSWFGYYDRAGTYTKFPNSLLVFDHDTLSSAGLLLGQ